MSSNPCIHMDHGGEDLQ